MGSTGPGRLVPLRRALPLPALAASVAALSDRHLAGRSRSRARIHHRLRIPRHGVHGRRMPHARALECVLPVEHRSLHPDRSPWRRLPSSRLAAAKARAWRRSSGCSSGYSWKISSRSEYVAIASRARRTVIRKPRIQGCPFMTTGSLVMRSNDADID